MKATEEIGTTLLCTSCRCLVTFPRSRGALSVVLLETDSYPEPCFGAASLVNKVTLQTEINIFDGSSGG